jgi:hypothetical protein
VGGEAAGARRHGDLRGREAVDPSRRRIHETAPPAPGGGQLVEHEYERLGAVTYPDAWDVRQIMGGTERNGGIEPLDCLVWQVMTKEPYRSANRVFWIVDNGSDHPGRRRSSASRVDGGT